MQRILEIRDALLKKGKVTEDETNVREIQHNINCVECEVHIQRTHGIQNLYKLV